MREWKGLYGRRELRGCGETGDLFSGIKINFRIWSAFLKSKNNLNLILNKAFWFIITKTYHDSIEYNLY